MTEVQNCYGCRKKSSYNSVVSGFNTLTTQNMESYGLLTNIGLNIKSDLRRCTNYVAFQDVSFKNYLAKK